MANEEHLKVLNQGVGAWNQWRKEHSRLEPDLSGTNLIAKQLSGAFLRRTDLKRTNLSNANLQDTVLRGANLCNADLSYTNLRNSSIPSV